MIIFVDHENEQSAYGDVIKMADVMLHYSQVEPLPESLESCCRWSYGGRGRSVYPVVLRGSGEQMPPGGEMWQNCPFLRSVVPPPVATLLWGPPCSSTFFS